MPDDELKTLPHAFFQIRPPSRESIYIFLIPFWFLIKCSFNVSKIFPVTFNFCTLCSVHDIWFLPSAFVANWFELLIWLYYFQRMEQIMAQVMSSRQIFFTAMYLIVERRTNLNHTWYIYVNIRVYLPWLSWSQILSVVEHITGRFV